jgi:hypothetical protein
MQEPKNAEEITKLCGLVQEMLDQYVSQSRLPFTLKVSKDVLQQDEWVYLIVVPDKEGVRAYDYVNALTDVEKKLREDKHEENVLLVPALAA